MDMAIIDNDSVHIENECRRPVSTMQAGVHNAGKCARGGTRGAACVRQTSWTPTVYYSL